MLYSIYQKHWQQLETRVNTISKDSIFRLNYTNMWHCLIQTAHLGESLCVLMQCQLSQCALWSVAVIVQLQSGPAIPKLRLPLVNTYHQSIMESYLLAVRIERPISIGSQNWGTYLHWQSELRDLSPLAVRIEGLIFIGSQNWGAYLHWQSDLRDLSLLAVRIEGPISIGSENWGTYLHWQSVLRDLSSLAVRIEGPISVGSQIWGAYLYWQSDLRDLSPLAVRIEWPISIGSENWGTYLHWQSEWMGPIFIGSQNWGTYLHWQSVLRDLSPLQVRIKGPITGVVVVWECFPCVIKVV